MRRGFPPGLGLSTRPQGELSWWRVLKYDSFVDLAVLGFLLTHSNQQRMNVVQMEIQHKEIIHKPLDGFLKPHLEPSHPHHMYSHSSF